VDTVVFGFSGEGLDEVAVLVGPGECGTVRGLVFHEDRRVVDRVQGEDREGDLAGEVAVVGEVTECGGVGREPGRPALRARSSCESVYRTPWLPNGLRPPSRFPTMSWNRKKVAYCRYVGSERSGIVVTAVMSSRFCCYQGVRAEAMPVHSWRRPMTSSGVSVEFAGSPCHSGYCGSVGRGRLRQ
jgi:hypothetical protein